MDKKLNEQITSAQLEQSKLAAQKLAEGWRGLDDFKKPVAGSYQEDPAVVNPTPINESKEQATSNKFDLGLLRVISALKNSSIAELPAGKYLIENYSNLILHKRLNEAEVIQPFLNDLKNFTWDESIKQVVKNLDESVNKNIREIEVLKATEAIKKSAGRDLFSEISESMETWVNSENKNTPDLLKSLSKWSFNPIVRNLINSLSVLENRTSNSFNIRITNDNCLVNPIYAPVLVKENATYFVAGGRFYRTSEKGIRLLEKSELKNLPQRFLTAVLALTDQNVRITENAIEYIPTRGLKIVFSLNEAKVMVNDKVLPERDLGLALSMLGNTIFSTNQPIIEKANILAASKSYLAEVDYGKNIQSKLYEGVQANIFKYGSKVYIQKINPAMKTNTLLEANGTQAVNIIKEFLQFDLSESLTEFLEGDDKIKSIMHNDRNEIIKNIKIVEDQQEKLGRALQTNPRLAESAEIKKAKEMLESESSVLKEKWNAINAEIEKFENQAKVFVINETSDTYPTETPVVIKRTGAKGKVIGVNSSSKTYTIMMEGGSSAEFFFSDVAETGESLGDTQISTPDIVDDEQPIVSDEAVAENTSAVQEQQEYSDDTEEDEDTDQEDSCDEENEEEETSDEQAEDVDDLDNDEDENEPSDEDSESDTDDEEIPEEEETEADETIEDTENEDSYEESDDEENSNTFDLSAAEDGSWVDMPLALESKETQGVNIKDMNLADHLKVSGKKAKETQGANVKDMKLANHLKVSGKKAKETKGVNKKIMGLADFTKKSGKKAKETKGIKTKDMNLANHLKVSGKKAKETQGANVKDMKLADFTKATGKKAVETNGVNTSAMNLAEGKQSNKNFESAPKGPKKKVVKKEIKNVKKEAKLAKAPGSNKLDGKKDVQNLKDSNLATAPKK